MQTAIETAIETFRITRGLLFLYSSETSEDIDASLADWQTQQDSLGCDDDISIHLNGEVANWKTYAF